MRETLEFVGVIAVLLFVLIGAAVLLAEAHSPEREACVKSGNTWSATKFVCVANLKKE